MRLKISENLTTPTISISIPLDVSKVNFSHRQKRIYVYRMFWSFLAEDIAIQIRL
jgi:hypothetical protein